MRAGEQRVSDPRAIISLLLKTMLAGGKKEENS